ncbi:hypothetical protein D3C79_901290 [compost metagenome]
MLAAELGDGGAQGRALIGAADQIRLFFRAAFIDPFEPAVNRYDGPVWPDGAKERAMGDLLHSRVDGRGVVLGPVRPPAPGQQVRVQAGGRDMQQCHRCARCQIEVPKRLITDVVDQSTRHAQGVDEIVDATVLGQPAAHAAMLREVPIG